MNTIKNINRLHGITSPEALVKLEAGAALHRQHANIEFKIFKVEDNVITIGIKQGKSQAENYLSQKDLRERGKELFAPFVNDHKLQFHATSYVVHECQVIVSPEWLQKQMLERSVRIKDIAETTGLENSNISSWVNGNRPMSNIVKAMFYYYFRSQPGPTVQASALEPNRQIEQHGSKQQP